MKKEGEEPQEQKVFKLKSSLIGTSLIVVGLLLAMGHGTLLGYHLVDEHGIPATLIHHLATALLIAGMWHAIEVFLSRKEFFEVLGKVLRDSLAPIATSERKLETQLHDIQDQIHASRHERSLGFVRSYVESHPEMYEDLITKSQELTVVLNNGHVWLHTQRDSLKDRLEDVNKSTRFIFLNPSSPAAEFMEEKEGMVKGGYKTRLGEALSLLHDLSKPNGRLEIYCMGLLSVQAIFLSESQVLVVPRFVIESSVPPIFAFEKNDHKKSYYRKISDDVDHLLKHPETTKIFPENAIAVKVENGHDIVQANNSVPLDRRPVADRNKSGRPRAGGGK